VAKCGDAGRMRVTGLYTDGAQGIVTCKQILRRFRGAGTVQRWCSGPVKELFKECAKVLGDWDCTPSVRRAWVTGTAHR
jgi:hypothetical protein